MTQKNHKPGTANDDEGNPVNLGGEATAASGPVSSISGGRPAKPLNIVAHSALNAFLDRMREFILSSLGHSQQPAGVADDGDETSNTDARTDLRFPGTENGKAIGTVIDIFAAPPYAGGRSAKGVATYAVLPPSQDVAVKKVGRHTFKMSKAKKEDRSSLPITGDGSWRIHVNTQKYASEADRANGAVTKVRGKVEVAGDILKALGHIRAGNIGRNATWKKDMSALGFVAVSTGKRQAKTRKPILSWAQPAMSPSLVDKLTKMTDSLPDIPENLFIDYLAFQMDPSAPKTGGFAAYLCPVEEEATDPTQASEDNPEGKVKVACPLETVRVGRKVKAAMDAQSKVLTCAWHGATLVYQPTPAEVAEAEKAVKIAAKRQRGA